MVVAVVTWELHLNGCQSLKDKRRILKSLKDRLHNRCNVSVAETDYQDLWQRAELACCVIATDRKRADSVLSAAARLVEHEPLARIIHSEKHML